MKKLLTVGFLMLLSLSTIAQQRTRGDSLYYQGSWYAPADYKRVKAEREKTNFETYFMPGVGYSIYQPEISDSLGRFGGLTIEYLIFGKVEQNDNSGPSHVRFYSKLSILKSNQENVGSMLMYSLGLDLSLEKNPKRRYLIPYFGLEMGGMSQKQFGSTLQFTPIVGVHVFSSKNLFVNIHGGYVYPLSNFETLQGWTGQVGVNFALW